MRFVKDGRGRVAAVPPAGRVRDPVFRGITYFAVDPAGVRTLIDAAMVDEYLDAGWSVQREAPSGAVWGDATVDEWREANTPLPPGQVKKVE